MKLEADATARSVGGALEGSGAGASTPGEVAQFLANASRVLAEAFNGAGSDYERTLITLAEVAVPAIADGCAIDVVEEEYGAIRRVVVRVSNPAKTSWAERLRRIGPPNPDAPNGVRRILAEGRSILFREVEADVLSMGARDPEHLEILRALELKSAMVLPLRARGRSIGIIWLYTSESGRSYVADDLALAEDLAGRAAMAIDHALLYERTRDAVRLRDDFLSVAGHELRTPLTTLSLQLSSLQRRPVAGEALQDRLASLARQTERVCALVDALLDVSRLSAGRLELDVADVDLVELVREVSSRFELELARSGSEISVLADGPVMGRWDRVRLDQVVSNLVANAIKYGRGQPIRVCVEVKGASALLIVRDAGIGIPAEEHDRIFDRFERAASGRQFGGLGLGLWIAREIVDAFGGTIAVDSRAGEGSSFTVTLPRGLSSGEAGS